MGVFAIGDIHGCIRAFEILLDTIKPNKQDKLVLLGDYINKGPDSKAVVDKVVWLIGNGFQVKALRGNHEQMLLNALKNTSANKQFIEKGGDHTLANFQIEKVDEMPKNYVDFFQQLSFYHKHGKYLFVHGGFNQQLANPFDDEYFMLWKCNKEYNHVKLKDKMIIHGHCPIPENTFNEQFSKNKTNCINLDSGCVYGRKDGFGRLTAYECISGKVFQVEEPAHY